MIVPKTVTHWVPITCNYCAEFCAGNFSNQGREDPGFNPQFVDKFCSDSNLIQYYFIRFTLGLLINAIIIYIFPNVACPGIRSNGNESMKRFGELLGKEKILERMEFSDVTELEAFETKLKLRWSSTYFVSRLTKTAIKISLGLFYFIALSIDTMGAFWFEAYDLDLFVCDLKTYHFECLASPGYFMELSGKVSL